MAETFLYLTTTGRKTGNPHKIEIWFVEDAGCYYLCAEGRDNAHWVQNIRKSSDVLFYLAAGRDVTPTTQQQGTAIPLNGTHEKVEHLKKELDQKYNWSNGLLVEICPKTEG